MSVGARMLRSQSVIPRSVSSLQAARKRSQSVMLRLIGDGRRFHVQSRAALDRAGPLLHDAAAPGEGAPQFRQVLERACDSTAFQPSSFAGGSNSLPFFGFSPPAVAFPRGNGPFENTLTRTPGVSTWKRHQCELCAVLGCRLTGETFPAKFSDARRVPQATRLQP
jgi:hypothetical protein